MICLEKVEITCNGSCINLDLSFSKYTGAMTNFSLIWEAAVGIDNENGLSSRALSEIFVVCLNLVVRKVEDINISETMQFPTKKKS